MDKNDEIAAMFVLMVLSGKWEEAKRDMKEKVKAIKDKQRKREIEALERELQYKTRMLGVLKNESYR